MAERERRRTTGRSVVVALRRGVTFGLAVGGALYVARYYALAGVVRFIAGGLPLPGSRAIICTAAALGLACFWANLRRGRAYGGAGAADGHRYGVALLYVDGSDLDNGSRAASSRRGSDDGARVFHWRGSAAASRDLHADAGQDVTS